MTTRGAYYIAVNAGASVPLSLSASSLARHNPGLPIAVATDHADEVRDKLGSRAQVIEVPRHILPGRPDYPDHGFFSKVAHMYKSPFDLTLFLDFDTFILGDVSEIFTLLEQGLFDMAMAHDVGRSGNCPYGAAIPMAFRMFNTGVIAFRKCAAVGNVMAAWWKNMLGLDSAWGDQPAFMKAVWEAAGLRYATLPCEWNLRFIYPTAPYNQVVILHGRPLSEAVGPAEIGARINKVSDTGRFWFKGRSYGHYDLSTGELA